MEEDEAMGEVEGVEEEEEEEDDDDDEEEAEDEEAAEEEEDEEEEAAFSGMSSLVRDLSVSRYSCWLAASTWARMSASALE